MVYLISDGKNLSSSKALGMTSIFDSKPYVEKKFRSNVAKRRKSLDHLEQLFKDFLPLLQHLSETNSPSAKVFRDYLTWIQSQLEIFKKDPSAKQFHSLDSEITQFDAKLRLAFDYLNVTSREYSNKRISAFSKHKVHINLIPEVQSNFTLFIEKGLKAYPAFIDVYGLWLSPSELDSIIHKKECDYLSYSVLAVIAKFILPEKSHEYNAFYPTFLEHSVNSISQCYTTPSIEGVVSLCFMAMIYISECKFETALAYFTSALKMFQIIDHEKSAKYFMAVFEKSHFSKIESLRNALTLTSTIFNTVMPDAPPFEFDSQPILLKLDANIYQKKLDHINYYGESVPNLCNRRVVSFDVENKLIELFTTITSHIQMVRKKYRPFDQPELVPPFELRLPLEKYNKMFKLLLDLEGTFEDELKAGNSLFFAQDFHFITYVDYDNTVNTKFSNPHESHILIFIHSLFLFLIYPSVLVEPRPILFSLDEMRILFNAANTITQFFIDLILRYKALKPELSCSKSIKKKLDKPLGEFSAHPMQITYPLYVYLNLISLSQEPRYDPFTKDDILKCESITLDIFKMLRELSQADIDAFSNESILAIDKVAKSLPNYNLPKPFLDAAMEILIIDGSVDN